MNMPGNAASSPVGLLVDRSVGGDVVFTAPAVGTQWPGRADQRTGDVGPGDGEHPVTPCHRHQHPQVFTGPIGMEPFELVNPPQSIQGIIETDHLATDLPERLMIAQIDGLAMQSQRPLSLGVQVLEGMAGGAGEDEGLGHLHDGEPGGVQIQPTHDLGRFTAAMAPTQPIMVPIALHQRAVDEDAQGNLLLVRRGIIHWRNFLHWARAVRSGEKRFCLAR